MAGPFYKCLTPEFVASIAPMNEVHLTTLFGDGGHTAEPLNFASFGKGVTIRAEEGGEPRSVNRACARQASEDRRFFVLSCCLRNELVEVLYGSGQGLKLSSECFDEFGVGFENNGIDAKRDGFGDEL